MSLRGKFVASATRSTAKSLCIVMVCTDSSEADQVSRMLLELNRGILVTYRRMEDLMLGTPAGEVALVILATRDAPEGVRGMLKWLRHRWPGCPVTVVGDEGGDGHELAAREGGASYLARPVEPEYWSAVLTHALGDQPKVNSRELP